NFTNINSYQEQSMTNTLTLHDALPICDDTKFLVSSHGSVTDGCCNPCITNFINLSARSGYCDAYAALLVEAIEATNGIGINVARDRKSTRLNSSHQIISYAVFCLKKKI